MSAKLFRLYPVFLAILVFSVISPGSADVITFDDISTTAFSNGVQYYTIANVTNGYQGFNWSNFYTLNVPLYVKTRGTNGEYYGMVTASNVAFNGGGTAAEIDSGGANFSFLSAYMTGVWNSNLNIEVEGFSGTNLVYDQTVVASATNPALYTFNYADIDRLTFNSFGGENAGFPNGGGEQFAMDNFTFEFVPEPSSLLLSALGCVSLIAFLRRRRA